MNKNRTTIQVDLDVIDRLREIAKIERRSMAQQISYWVDQHYAQLQLEAS